MTQKSGIFIVPRASTSWRGNEAGWITTAGWASASEETWGDAMVATTDGVFSARETMSFPRGVNKSVPNSKNGNPLRKLVPEIFITAYKDLKLKKSKPKVWPIEKEEYWKDKDIKLVWERHDLFSGPGSRLANKLKVPLVISVEALAVWEAKKWGVNRPFWGKWLEENVEAKSLKAADLVCCVSQEVKNKVVAMGVEEKKVIVTPNRVDSTLFHPAIDGAGIADRYNLRNKKVIGWTGSFRGFHALDHVVNAFEIVHKKHPDTVLMLVGDGLEFEKIKGIVHSKNLQDYVIMTGKRDFIEVPSYIVNFDVSVVSARSAEGFHYSPLKLREYLAVGKAVIAPKAGDLPQIFNEGEDLLFYEAGNYHDLSNQILKILEDKKIRNKLVTNAKQWLREEGAWTHELKKVCEILHISS
jgi:glycosyltransferase involved in cell wall biosynthesis